MEIEELLQPRYKVIADYPGNHWEIGFIYSPLSKDSIYWSTLESCKARKAMLDKYPHLFQPLPWWSDRKESDLPKYLRYTENDAIYKVIEYGKSPDRWTYIEGRHGESLLNYYLPATEKEYTDYQAFISTTKK